MNNTIIPSFYFSNKFFHYKDIIQKYDVQKVKFPKDSLLTNYGKINNTAYYINSGILLLSLAHEKGGEKSLALFGPGSIFPIGLTNHKYKMDFEIILRAFSDLDVYKFSYLTLRKMACDNHNLAIDLLEEDCDFTSYLFHDSVSQAFDPCITRLCDVLYLYLVSTHIENNIIKISQNFLSNIVGASRAQIERALKELRDEKVLETSRNKIIILNLENLLEYCSDNVRNF
ncbi:Crp/Fnr family transcriptional regulator [Clostridium algoriphilum]|uniref:Crp/Fnr family transcriptional regulator n=1 Tax=Clostridium algoriphilum TaxID=198347 RepID=UPI001CF2B21E|nr:Crp/Fnr family transcriptional regulator [Clostridium algoriphilum]MCB2293996.1 Crp/Fnr family transcriptional regulator [Clostridium algoriphilum]